jgi:hypothetical protein
MNTNHYIIYFVNGTHKHVETSLDLNDLDNLSKINIDYHNFDYLIKVDKKFNKNLLNFKKFLPDGNEIWKKEKLINFKIQNFLEKRRVLFEKLDTQFLISLEMPNNIQTEIIKKNKLFLRELSCRSELHNIHDCEKIFKFNAFYNLTHIEILDAGCGCSDRVPTVFISDPPETKNNFGIKATATAIVGSKGELLKITVQRLGSGYISLPEIKISGYESENAKHPILKPVVENII